MPVDGNIERVMSRLFAIEEPLPKSKTQITELATTFISPDRSGDVAQALMDLGATICTPKKPACSLCPLNDDCAALARGDAETFPRKAPKVAGAQRRGAAFVLVRGGTHVLLRTRPEKGLLGGMAEVPTTEWRADFDERESKGAGPRLKGVRLTWRRVPGEVTHVFTHFPLELSVHVARIDRGRAPAGARFVAIDALPAEALPNLMRKVIAHALA
jgi:A/G-specific adenine glycosylase